MSIYAKIVIFHLVFCVLSSLHFKKFTFSCKYCEQSTQLDTLIFKWENIHFALWRSSQSSSHCKWRFNFFSSASISSQQQTSLTFFLFLSTNDYIQLAVFSATRLRCSSRFMSGSRKNLKSKEIRVNHWEYQAIETHICSNINMELKQ